MYLASTSNQITSATAGYGMTVAAHQASRTRTAAQPDLAERGRLSAVVIKLLDDAGDAIYRDRDAARVCIARASALLREDIHQGRAPATLVQGGLAPWQISRVK